MPSTNHFPLHPGAAKGPGGSGGAGGAGQQGRGPCILMTAARSNYPHKYEVSSGAARVCV